MIRQATVSDVPDLVTMGLRFMRETSYRGQMAENPAQIAAFIASLIETPAAGTVFVSERAGLVTGTIVLLRFVHPFSGEVVVSELAWWVNPEARGDGVKLLKRAEAWAVEVGAAVMQMIAPTPQVAALYARLGYTRLEEAFQRRVA